MYHYNPFKYFYIQAALSALLGFSFANLEPHIRRIIRRFVEKIYNEHLLKMEFSIQQLNYFVDQLKTPIRVLQVYLILSIMLLATQIITIQSAGILFDETNLAKISKLNVDNRTIHFKCSLVNSTALNSTKLIIEKIKEDIRCTNMQYNLNLIFYGLFLFISAIIFLLLLFNTIEFFVVFSKCIRKIMILKLMLIDDQIIEKFKNDPNVYFAFVILLEYIGPKYFITFRRSLEENYDLVVEEAVEDMNDEDMLIIS